MVKKLVNLSQAEIDYVQAIAKTIGDPRAVTGNFSKALRKIIDDHKNGKIIVPINPTN